MANITATQKKTPVHTHVLADITDASTTLADYQKTLVAWTNIQIAADGVTISATDTTYSQATSDTLGLIKLWSDTAQSVAANAVSNKALRTYAIQVNSSGQAVVNVPWENDDTTYSTATSSVAGLVKLGSDTEQTVAAESVSATANRTYAIQLNDADQMVVNVPWVNTTYDIVTLNELNTGTSTVAKVVSAKVISDYVSAKVSAVYRFKWSVSTYGDLPSTGNVIGDVYNIETADASHDINAGDNVAWTGTAWDKLGWDFDLSDYYTAAQINTLTGLSGATAGFSATDVSAADASTKQVTITDQTSNQSIDGALDKDAASIKNLANAYNALETRVDSDETDIGNRYTKTEINTMTGLSGASAGFSSTALSVNSTTKQMSSSDTTDSQTIDAAQDANVTAFKAIKNAYNALEDRVDALESGDNEDTKFYQVTFSGTSHTYSDSFITADSFVQYNFASDPAGYVEFEVQAGKIAIKSSATESSLVHYNVFSESGWGRAFWKNVSMYLAASNRNIANSYYLHLDLLLLKHVRTHSIDLEAFLDARNSLGFHALLLTFLLGGGRGI